MAKESSGKNKGEASEIYANLIFITELKVDEIYFGNRIRMVLQDDDSYNLYNINTGIVVKNIKIIDLSKIRDELKKEILESLNNKGSYHYKSIDKLMNILNCTKEDLTAPNHITVDTIAEFKNYSIKSSVGSYPAIFNYSQSTTHIYKIKDTDEFSEKMHEYKRKIKEKKMSKNDVLRELIQNDMIDLDGSKFVNKDFYNFLFNIDSSLPKIVMKLMYNKTKFKKTKLLDLLEDDDIKIFKKFLLLCTQGLVVGNFTTFKPIELYEFKLDKDLNYTITKYDEKYVDKMVCNIVVDRGSSSRTKFGEIKYHDGYWWFTDDIYLRYK